MVQWMSIEPLHQVVSELGAFIWCFVLLTSSGEYDDAENRCLNSVISVTFVCEFDVNINSKDGLIARFATHMLCCKCWQGEIMCMGCGFKGFHWQTIFVLFYYFILFIFFADNFGFWEHPDTFHCWGSYTQMLLCEDVSVGVEQVMWYTLASEVVPVMGPVYYVINDVTF